MGKLAGRTILIAGDGICSVTTLVVVQAVLDEGGAVDICTSAQDALTEIDADGIAAAVVDRAMCQMHPEVCERLDALGIPYVLHEHLAEMPGGKLLSADELIEKMVKMLERTASQQGVAWLG